MTMTWIAFLLYLAASLVLGWVAQKQQDAGADFWTAGRSLGAVSVGLSISAGFMSVSWSCVYAVQLFYWYGLGALWLITIPWLIALSGIYFLSKRYRHLPAFSQPEMIAQRFGIGTKRMTALALAFVFLVWGGAEIYVAGTLLAPQLGISIPWVIFIISLIVGTYSVMGGFRAVVLTDKMQYWLVAIYILTMGWLAIKGLGKVDMAALTLPIHGAKSGTAWSNIWAPGIAVILLTLVAYLPGWMFETDLWLRVQAAKDDKSARRGVFIAGMNSFLFVGVLPMCIGVAALFIFPMNGPTFPATIGVEGNAIFSALVLRFAPGWLAAVVAVGLTAAAMSTIDTCINVMALSLGYDMGDIHKRQGAETWSKLVTIFSVLMSFLFALNTESLWDIFYLSSGILTTAVAFPVAAVFIPRARARGVFWSSVCGFCTTSSCYFLESRGLLRTVEPLWLVNSGLGYIFWGMLGAVLGYLIGHTLSPKHPTPQKT